MLHYYCIPRTTALSPQATQITVEPRYNEPLYNKVLRIMNDFHYPSNNKIYKTKPRYSEQILPVPWPFVASRVHCTSHLLSKGSTFILRYSQFTHVVSGLAFGIKPWIKST